MGGQMRLALLQAAGRVEEVDADADADEEDEQCVERGVW